MLRGKKPRRTRKDPAKKPARKGLGKGFKQQFLTLIRIAIPGLGSTAALRLYVYTALNLLRGYLNIKLVLVGSTGLQRITEMDWHKMFYQQSIYMSLCVPLAALNAGMRYVQNRLALVSKPHDPRRPISPPVPKMPANRPQTVLAAVSQRCQHQSCGQDMRSNLVSHIHENYLDEQSTFYRMSAVGQELLSTLDQRCTADIEEFAVDTAVLYGNLIKPAIEIVSFSAQVSAAALLSALVEKAESSEKVHKLLRRSGRIRARASSGSSWPTSCCRPSGSR